MGQRSEPLPEEIDALLDGFAGDFPSRPQTGIMWAALRSCYATESDAVEAERRSPGIILPYMNRPGNIVGSFAVLVDKLGDEQAARALCQQNPAVLGTSPKGLAECSAADIRSAAAFREAVDRLPLGLRFWASAFAAVVVLGVLLALLEPS